MNTTTTTTLTSTLTSTFTLGNVVCTMTLADFGSDGDCGRWVNGVVSLPDGRTFAAGGGYIHDDGSAWTENQRCGRQTDLPGIHWPGAVGAGDLDSYEGYDCGYIEELAAACGVNVDRDTEAGEAGWREVVAAIRSATDDAWQVVETVYGS